MRVTNFLTAIAVELSACAPRPEHIVSCIPASADSSFDSVSALPSTAVPAIAFDTRSIVWASTPEIFALNGNGEVIPVPVSATVENRANGFVLHPSAPLEDGAYHFHLNGVGDFPFVVEDVTPVHRGERLLDVSPGVALGRLQLDLHLQSWLPGEWWEIELSTDNGASWTAPHLVVKDSATVVFGENASECGTPWREPIALAEGAALLLRFAVAYTDGEKTEISELLVEM